jgi:hypothetical protein
MAAEDAVKGARTVTCFILMTVMEKTAVISGRMRMPSGIRCQKTVPEITKYRAVN